MKLACLRTGRLLDKREQGLSAAEGLALEEHLGSCASCLADANLLQGLSALSAQEPSALSEAARQRAIANAFAAGTAPQPGLTAQRARRNGLLLVAAAAACMAVWFGSRALTRSSAVARVAPVARVARVAPAIPVISVAPMIKTAGDRASAERTAELAAAAEAERGVAPSAEPATNTAALDPSQALDRVLSGHVEVLGRTLGAGQRLRAHARLRASEAASVALAHARVELRAGAEASWDGRVRKLSLPHGSALIEVDPSRQQSFQVVTRAFTVAVLGTRFEVTQDAVYVLRGRVSVTRKTSPASTAPLLLEADSDHAQFQLQPSAARQSAPEAASAARTQRAASAAKTGRAHTAAELLEQARAQLAAREQAQARSTLELAKPLLLDDASRAQALSLEAECELQAHDYSGARDSYLKVGQRFPSLPAAETALFAAARIEAEHGRATMAVELLNRYLSQYPGGSFAREATLRLGQLQRGAVAEPAR